MAYLRNPPYLVSAYSGVLFPTAVKDHLNLDEVQTAKVARKSKSVLQWLLILRRFATGNCVGYLSQMTAKYGSVNQNFSSWFLEIGQSAGIRIFLRSFPLDNLHIFRYHINAKSKVITNLTLTRAQLLFLIFVQIQTVRWSRTCPISMQVLIYKFDWLLELNDQKIHSSEISDSFFEQAKSCAQNNVREMSKRWTVLLSKYSLKYLSKMDETNSAYAHT